MDIKCATVAITIEDKVDKCAESSPDRAMNESAKRVTLGGQVGG